MRRSFLFIFVLIFLVFTSCGTSSYYYYLIDNLGNNKYFNETAYDVGWNTEGMTPLITGIVFYNMDTKPDNNTIVITGKIRREIFKEIITNILLNIFGFNNITSFYIWKGTIHANGQDFPLEVKYEFDAIGKRENGEINRDYSEPAKMFIYSFKSPFSNMKLSTSDDNNLYNVPYPLINATIDGWKYIYYMTIGFIWLNRNPKNRVFNASFLLSYINQKFQVIENNNDLVAQLENNKYSIYKQLSSEKQSMITFLLGYCVILQKIAIELDKW